MPKLEIEIVNGGLGRASLNTDNWGGLFVEQTALPSGWADNEVKKILKVEDVAEYGIVETATDQNLKLAYWHISEVFRVTKLRGVDATLFVQLSTTVSDYDVINTAFKNSDDRIRNLAYVFTTLTLSDSEVSDLHDSIEKLWSDYYMGARGIVSYKKDAGDAIPDFSATDYNRVKVDISNDLTVGGIAKAIFDGTLGMCGGAGMMLGQRLGLSVHQKSSWRAKEINSEGRWATLGDINGDSVENKTEAEKTAYETLGVDLVLRQLKLVDAFIANDRVATAISDDYAFMNNANVIDKAAYLAYMGLVRSLDRPIYVDPATGYLDPESISVLQSAAYNSINTNMVIGRTGDDVEVSIDRATGSLPRRAIYIDPKQNLIGSDKIFVEIRIVPVKSAEEISVTIGLTANLA